MAATWDTGKVIAAIGRSYSRAARHGAFWVSPMHSESTSRARSVCPSTALHWLVRQPVCPRQCALSCDQTDRVTPAQGLIRGSKMQFLPLAGFK